MADFEQLIAQAHQRGIKIVMDMVFNHSSTFHRWFVEGEDPNSEYHDYYIWRESQLIGSQNLAVQHGNGLIKRKNIICIYLPPSRRI
ncbi:trehalose-6-phosphate hydrolase [Pasteurella canis]|nr:trehalose-6-phosphate hydrolase [Pasteurella canis]